MKPIKLVSISSHQDSGIVLWYRIGEKPPEWVLTLNQVDFKSTCLYPAEFVWGIDKFMNQIGLVDIPTRFGRHTGRIYRVEFSAVINLTHADKSYTRESVIDPVGLMKLKSALEAYADPDPDY